ncbi:MAG TPA: glycosyltransferase family 4 protein [Candidatus Nanoarchaeia archaeon]|nr:glycosyltransferase family 4 protein [Candidatus Nanoarchaeia archaeon]
MRICILSTTYPRYKEDAWVPFTHSLSKELAKKHQVTVVTSSDIAAKDYEKRDKVKIIRFIYFLPKKWQMLTYRGGMLESFNSSLLAKVQAPLFLLSFFLKALKHSRRCDIIHAYWSLSGLIAVLVSKIRKKPIVLTLHGSDIRSLPRWLNRYVVNNVDAVVSAHHELLDIAEKLGRKEELYNIKNPIDSKFYSKIKTDGVKKEFGLKVEYVVSFIGRLEPMKDPLTFIKAIPFVLAQMNGIKFFLVGDGHLMQEAVRLAEKLKVKEHLFIIGQRHDTHEILKATDIFIAISPLENCFSTTIIESMSLKVPCIITDAGYTKKFFTHRKDCYLVKSRDEKELANAIITLLLEQDLRRKIALNGLKFLDNNKFNNSQIIKGYQAVYKSVFT